MARRIRAAVTPVIACDVKAAAGLLSMCLFNASTKPGEGLSVREIQDDEAKPARAWPVSPEVPVHDGVRRTWPIEGEAPGDLMVSEGRRAVRGGERDGTRRAAASSISGD